MDVVFDVVAVCGIVLVPYGRQYLSILVEEFANDIAERPEHGRPVMPAVTLLRNSVLAAVPEAMLFLQMNITLP